MKTKWCLGTGAGSVHFEAVIERLYWVKKKGENR